MSAETEDSSWLRSSSCTYDSAERKHDPHTCVLHMMRIACDAQSWQALHELHLGDSVESFQGVAPFKWIATVQGKHQSTPGIAWGLNHIMLRGE